MSIKFSTDTFRSGRDRTYDSKDVTVTFDGITITTLSEINVLHGHEPRDPIWSEGQNFHEDNIVSDQSWKIDDVAMLKAVNAELHRQGLRVADGENVFSAAEYLVDEMCDNLEDLVVVAPIIAKGPTSPKDVARLKEALAEIRASAVVHTIKMPQPGNWYSKEVDPVLTDVKPTTLQTHNAMNQIGNVVKAGGVLVVDDLFLREAAGGIQNMQHAVSCGWDLKYEPLQTEVKSGQVYQSKMMRMDLMESSVTYPSGVSSYTCRSHGCPHRAPSMNQCQCYTCGKTMEKL